MSVQAHYQLGIALRNAASYAAAIDELQAVVRLDANWAAGWRELGVTLSKSGHLTNAVEAFQHAVELDSSDAETWATLGGVRRRLARSRTGPAFDWAALREARDAYRRASQLRGNDTYSLVNEARLDLLLSAAEPAMRPAAIEDRRTRWFYGNHAGRPVRGPYCCDSGHCRTGANGAWSAVQSRSGSQHR